MGVCKQGSTTPFAKGIDRSVLEVWIVNILAETRYSAVLARTAVLRSSEIYWNEPDGPSWCSYDYPFADVRREPPTHRDVRNCSGSNPRACKTVIFVIAFDINLMFDEKERVARTVLETAL